MEPLELESIVRHSGGSWISPAPLPRLSVAELGTDTRTLGNQSVFLALSGPNFDGHSFVEEARRRGAVASVVKASRVAVLPPAGGPYIAVNEPLDALVLGVPAVTPHLPREAPNPLLAAYLGLGVALRLWRDAFPVVDGGTVILVHRFRRRFPHPTQLPYRAFFQAVSPSVRDRRALAAGERAVLADRRALDAYRSGRSCHPLLPFVDWDACRPALERLGAVLVADCRDAAAARMLDFVPTHGIGAALGMAEGRAGRAPRLGFLLSPPYFPLRVGSAANT